MRRALSAFAAASLMACPVISAADDAPSPFAFTVQGRLVQDNVAMSGSYLIEFSLWDDGVEGQGQQIGPTITCNDVDVVAGLFSESLDFGAVFDGTLLWLRIRVDVDPSGGFDFVVLDRRPVARAPMAEYADVAANGPLRAGPAPDEGDYLFLDADVRVATTLHTEGDLRASAIVGSESTPGHVLVPAAPGLPMWMRHRSGETPFAEAGSVYSSFDASHYFVTNTGPLSVRYSTEASAEPLLANASTLVAIDSTGDVEVSGDAEVMGTLRTSDLSVPTLAVGGANHIYVDPGGSQTELWTTYRSDSSPDGVSQAGALFSYRNEDHWFATNEGGAFKIGYTALGGSAPDWDDATAWIRVRTNGFVGLGPDPAPDYRLDVVGTVRADNIVPPPSDERLKIDIRDALYGLDDVLRLRPVTYRWRPDTRQERLLGDRVELGFTAQEVRRVCPEAVTEDADGILRLDYDRLVPVLVRGMQEQQVLIDDQTARIADLEAAAAERDELRERLERLEALIGGNR